MLNFNKDESCNFLQSLLINHYFDLSITSFMQQIIISYIQIFIFLLSTYTSIHSALHFVLPLHKRTCSTKSLAYLATCALVERSDLQHLRSSSRPLQQLLTLHSYFAVAAAIPRRLFFPILCCIVLFSEWLPTPDWSLLLYSSENETDQPCFYYKS